MRERERNLKMRRMSFHYFEKDGILLVNILSNLEGENQVVLNWTRLWAGRGEIKRLIQYLKRVDFEADMAKYRKRKA
jgi:hypothetical protein